jgi:hypothetical protein
MGSGCRYRAEMISLAVRYRLPAVYPWRSSLSLLVCCPTEVTSAICFGLRRLSSTYGELIIIVPASEDRPVEGLASDLSS